MFHFDGLAVVICPAQARQREVQVNVRLRSWGGNGPRSWGGSVTSTDGYALSSAMDFNHDLKIRLSDGRRAEIYLTQVTYHGTGIATGTITGRGRPPLSIAA